MSDFTPNSVSVPRDLADELQAITDEIDEPLAVIYRQIVRVGIARGWDAEKLRLRATRDGGDRRILRLAMTAEMKEKVDALAGEHSLGSWFRAAAEQVLELHRWGDRSIWSLLDP